MRVVSYNIQYCKGRDGKIDPQRVMDSVREADIIAFQEVDKAAARTGFIDQPQALGDGFLDYFWVYGPTVDALSRHHPRGNERRQFGNMILSRWPIAQSRNWRLECARLSGDRTSGDPQALHLPKHGDSHCQSPNQRKPSNDQ